MKAARTLPPAPAPARKSRLPPEARRSLLEDAARDCIARGGLRDFTVDKVCARAGVSRGLVIHHFGSMDGLLVSLYTRIYRDWIAALAAPRPGFSRIEALVEALVSPPLFDPEALAVWLALWAEVAANPRLRAAHRQLYGDYRATVAAAIAEAAAQAGRDRPVDTEALAEAFICMADGLAVQRCVEPALLPETRARAICRTLLAPLVGPAAPAPQIPE